MKDQCDTEKYYFSWSGLDLQLKLSVPDRKPRLKNIIAFYCTIIVPTVQKYTNQNEKGSVENTWEGYKVRLEYPSKTDFSEEELSKELEKSFQTVNRLHLTEVTQAKLAKSEVN